MTIKKKEAQTRVTVDLTGPEGNAFVLLGYANSWGEQLGLSEEERDEIHDDMTSSDYDHLVSVLDSHFGGFIDFLT